MISELGPHNNSYQLWNVYLMAAKEVPSGDSLLNNCNRYGSGRLGKNFFYLFKESIEVS